MKDLNFWKRSGTIWTFYFFWVTVLVLSHFFGSKLGDAKLFEPNWWGQVVAFIVGYLAIQPIAYKMYPVKNEGGNK